MWIQALVLLNYHVGGVIQLSLRLFKDVLGYITEKSSTQASAETLLSYFDGCYHHQKYITYLEHDKSSCELEPRSSYFFFHIEEEGIN